MKYVVVMAAMLLAGCASSDIRNWNPEAKTGRIVVFSGENLFSPPTIKDAHDDLMEKCPSGYEVLKKGWQGSGVYITPAMNPKSVTTTTNSISVGGREVFAVVKSKSKSGIDTVIKVGNYQTERTADGGTTVVRSPNISITRQEGTAKYFDFRCK